MAQHSRERQVSGVRQAAGEGQPGSPDSGRRRSAAVPERGQTAASWQLVRILI